METKMRDNGLHGTILERNRIQDNLDFFYGRYMDYYRNEKVW